MQEVFSLDLGRLIFTSALLLSFVFFCIKTKRPFYISTIFLLIVLPFNITLQQPNYDVYISGLSSNYIVPTLSILDVFVFLVLFFSFKEKKLKKNHKIFFTILFLFFTTKAFLDNEIISTLQIYRLFFYALCATYIVQEFPLKKNIKTISYILLSSTIVQATIGILQFRQGHNLGFHFLGESNLVKGMFGTSFVDIDGILFLRAYGTFPHPNILAGFLLFTLIFSLANVKRAQINWITGVLSTILIFFTFSRIAIFLSVVFWIGFLLFKIFKKQKEKKEKQLSFLSIYPLFITRFFNLFLENDGSFSDRVELLKTAREILRNHPFFGIGAGRFVYGLDYYPVYTAGGFLLLQPVHNVPLLLLAEYGIVFGLPLILLIVFFLVRGFLRGGVFLKYAIFSTVIILTFDHYFITLPQGIIFFTGILALCASAKRCEICPKMS